VRGNSCLNVSTEEKPSSENYIIAVEIVSVMSVMSVSLFTIYSTYHLFSIYVKNCTTSYYYLVAMKRVTLKSHSSKG
jgi:hypothetical protein